MACCPGAIPRSKSSQSSRRAISESAASFILFERLSLSPSRRSSHPSRLARLEATLQQEARPLSSSLLSALALAESVLQPHVRDSPLAGTRASASPRRVRKSPAEECMSPRTGFGSPCI